ncbi:hypothetical protein [Vibrio algivorus]|uniref:Uncharacterized protein n=1 Tax=Vibrio algivorus TaxID=1667024 RepID=A0ABQ6ERZ6_9VIBR|nr:hypothetical protein [Vibrio algivorus]GLT15511.1 hypothetical protein GCM10007931_24860 [Vibrio algivorus]
MITDFDELYIKHRDIVSDTLDEELKVMLEEFVCDTGFSLNNDLKTITNKVQQIALSKYAIKDKLEQHYSICPLCGANSKTYFIPRGFKLGTGGTRGNGLQMHLEGRTNGEQCTVMFSVYKISEFYDKLMNRRTFY